MLLHAPFHIATRPTSRRTPPLPYSVFLAGAAQRGVKDKVEGWVGIEPVAMCTGTAHRVSRSTCLVRMSTDCVWVNTTLRKRLSLILAADSGQLWARSNGPQQCPSPSTFMGSTSRHVAGVSSWPGDVRMNRPGTWSVTKSSACSSEVASM